MSAIVIPPSWSEDFGKSIASLAEGVANTVNPFHQLQVSARQQIVKDPSLAQHLSDLEDQSPGTLDALGLGKLGKVIAKIPPSEAQTLQKQQQAALAANQPNADTQAAMASKAQTGQLPEQRALTQSEAQISGERAAVGADVPQYLKDHPELAPIAGLMSLTGRSPGDLFGEAAKGSAFQDLQKRFPETENMDMMSVAHDFVTGQPVDEQLINAARINPATAGTWTEAEKYMTQRELQKASMKRWFDQGDKRLELEEMHEGFNMTMALGLPPSAAEDVRQALFTPAGRAKLKIAHDHPMIGDPAYVAIDKASTARGNSIAEKQLTPEDNDIYKSMRIFGDPKATPAEKTAAIDTYNNAERKKLGDNAPQARFGTSFGTHGQVELWQGQNKLSPSTGWQQLTESVMGVMGGNNQTAPTPTTAAAQPSGGLSPYGNTFLTQLEGLKGLTKSQLETNLTNHSKLLSPQDAVLIRQHFGFNQ